MYARGGNEACKSRLGQRIRPLSYNDAGLQDWSEVFRSLRSRMNVLYFNFGWQRDTSHPCTPNEQSTVNQLTTSSLAKWLHPNIENGCAHSSGCPQDLWCMMLWQIHLARKPSQILIAHSLWGVAERRSISDIKLIKSATMRLAPLKAYFASQNIDNTGKQRTLEASRGLILC